MKNIKLLLVLLAAPLLMGAKGCAVDLAKIGYAFSAASDVMMYEPTEADEQRFQELIDANRRATEDWMRRNNVPMGPGYVHTP